MARNTERKIHHGHEGVDFSRLEPAHLPGLLALSPVTLKITGYTLYLNGGEQLDGDDLEAVLRQKQPGDVVTGFHVLGWAKNFNTLSIHIDRRGDGPEFSAGGISISGEITAVTEYERRVRKALQGDLTQLLSHASGDVPKWKTFLEGAAQNYVGGIAVAATIAGLGVLAVLLAWLL